jgi:hypothetical protein
MCNHELNTAVCRPQLARELLTAAAPEDAVLAMVSTASHFGALREPATPEEWAEIQAKTERVAAEEAAKAAALADASPELNGRDDESSGEKQSEASSGPAGLEVMRLA